MNFIQAEIDKKRKERLEFETLALSKRLKTDQEPEANNARKKYIKRGELEKEREIKYLAEQEEESKKRQQNVQATEQKDKKAHTETPEHVVVPDLTVEEVIRRLRSRGEPITLFGESDIDRLKRLRKLEEREPVERNVGMDDDFGHTLRELTKHPEESNKNKEKKEEIVEEPDMSKVKTKEDFILAILKKLLKEWNMELESRTDIQKRAAQGKNDTVTYKQCKKHIRPLFKSLKKKTLPIDILNPVHDICNFLEKKEYVRAHDSYLRMSIGNAPWPMGVTMVGIHERSAREKIFTSQVAHVLNDETQRKYIQAVKRLMTFCQKKHQTDPSKTVG